MLRSLLLCAFISRALFALPQPIPELAVRNAASGANSVSPGAFASITIPPPLGAFPPDTVITLTPANGSAIPITPILPPAAVATPFELWFVIPSNANIGTATIATTVRGATYNNSIEIAGSASGLFSANYTGVGPALALNHPATRNALTTAAIPNGIVLLFASGLNGANATDVTVELAGQPIVPLYAGPQGTPGLDQINFVVPQGAAFGCYVPLAIRVRGVLSNQTSLSISSDPSTCAHPLGLSDTDLQTLDAGGSIPFAKFTVSSNILPGLSSPVDGADLFFPDATAAAVAALSTIPGTQPFSCSTVGYFVRSAGGSLNNPDAGTVSVSGPGGKQFDLKRSSYYSGTAPKTDDARFFFQGTWRVSASGGPDLGVFQRDFVLPPAFAFTNLGENTTVPSQGYVVRWDGSGFAPGDVMTLSINISDTFTNYVACSAPAWTGQLLLSNSVLEQFKGTTTLFDAAVRPAPSVRTSFSIPNNNGSPIPGFVDYSYTQRFSARVE